MQEYLVPREDAPSTPVPSTTSSYIGRVVSIMDRIMSDLTVPPERWEKAWEMSHRMLAEFGRFAFNEAFANAQKRFKPARKNRAIVVPPKDGKTGHTTPYADWLAHWVAVQEPLNDNGLSMWFDIEAAPGIPVSVTANLEHTNGHTRRVKMTFAHDATGSKNAAQAESSAVTYGKRVTGMAILNLVSEDDPADDDGVAIGATVVEIISPEQLSALGEKMKAANVPASAICTNCKIDTLADLPAAEFDGVMKRLDVTIKRKQQEPAL